MASSSVARESARKAKQADERALALAPIIAEIRASGAPTLYAIGADLTRRGIRTAHGNRFWGATQVHNLLKRLDRLAAGGRLPPNRMAERASRGQGEAFRSRHPECGQAPQRRPEDGGAALAPVLQQLDAVNAKRQVANAAARERRRPSSSVGMSGQPEAEASRRLDQMCSQRKSPAKSGAMLMLPNGNARLGKRTLD
jgi:hypothetical protein